MIKLRSQTVNIPLLFHNKELDLFFERSKNEGREWPNISIKYFVLVLLLLLALISDIKTYKISNKITFPFIAFGLIINLYLGSIRGIAASAAGILIPVLLLVFLFALHMLGAGDIKLFCAIGSICGKEFVLYSIACSFLMGGIIALVIMCCRKNGQYRLRYLLEYLKGCWLTFSLLPYSEFTDKTDGAKFHFAWAIVLGTLAAFSVQSGLLTLI